MESIVIKGKVFRKFIPEDQIIRIVQKIAGQINEDYYEKNPLLLGILNGAFIFAADLIRKITIPCQISFIKYASYSGTHTTSQIKVLIGLNEEIKDRHIIVVEDIVDTGLTMDHLLKEMWKFHPVSVRLACFCMKPEAFNKHFKIDYLGIEIPNDFVVGYGLDYDGYGRNLPGIYKL